VISVLEEVSHSMKGRTRSQSIPLTDARLRRMLDIYDRLEPRLSFLGSTAARAVMRTLNVFVGVPLEKYPKTLRSWRFPKNSKRLLAVLARRTRAGAVQSKAGHARKRTRL
jgi:hypothetical protein